MKKISIVSSCYNESENVDILYERVKAQMDKYEGKYDWEQILVDNGSKDNTAEKLKALAAKDNHVKVIINARNFGHIRSPYWAIINGSGDAVIYMASDLQDPPELIPDFIEKWENGYKMALGQKTSSKESKSMYFIRKIFYSLMKHIVDDDTEQIKQCTGFGLYDKQIVDILRSIDDPYPYLRGLICDIGFEKALISFVQPKRERGITHNNFYTLYDNAMIGIVKHSKVPLRMAAFIGFILSGLSMLIALFYFLYKLFYWDTFNVGQAPLVIGLFFFASVQLFFIGIVGEYVGAIYTRVNKKPIVVEKERINF
ncbi:MAG: glycosyltransferase [Candidatus Gastranaerophilaceae bacterium]